MLKCEDCLYFTRESRNIRAGFAALGGGQCLNKDIPVTHRYPHYSPYNETCFEYKEFILPEEEKDAILKDEQKS